jgi:hypothetical protein
MLPNTAPIHFAMHKPCPLWVISGLFAVHALSVLTFGKTSITDWPESAVNYNPSAVIAVGLGAKKFS